MRLVQGMYANAQSVSVLVRGTVKSLKWRLVFTKLSTLPAAFHHCA